jgi:hypothetical protein
MSEQKHEDLARAKKISERIYEQMEAIAEIWNGDVVTVWVRPTHIHVEVGRFHFRRDRKQPVTDDVAVECPECERNLLRAIARNVRRAQADPRPEGNPESIDFGKDSGRVF